MEGIYDEGEERGCRKLYGGEERELSLLLLWLL